MQRIFVFIIVSLLSAHSGFGKSLRSKKSSNSEVCQTEECHEAADRLKQMIDFSVDPCENFYDYACGTWRENNPSPGSSSRHNQFSIMQDQLAQKVQGILSSPIEDTDTEAVQKVKQFYKACIDLDTQESRGLSPLRRLIKKNGGWPLIDPTWDDSKYNLQSSLADMTRYLAVGSLFNVRIQPDLKNSTYKKILLDQPELFLPREYFLSPDFEDKVNYYKKFVKDVASELTPESSMDEETLEQEIDEFIAFETKLANISAKAEDRDDLNKTYNLYTVDEFQQYFNDGSDYSGIDWQKLLNRIFNGFTTIESEEEIIILQPEYLQNLAIILSETPLEVVVNYVQWRMVSMFVDDATNELRDIAFKYLKVSQGVKERKPRKDICSNFDITSRLFRLGEAVSSEYIKEYFPKIYKRNVTQMVHYLRASFSELLEAAIWMDEATQDKARDKIKKMAEFIGYPEFITNAKKLNKHYKKFEPDESRHFENILSFYKWEVHTILSEYRQPTDRSKMNGHAVFVNAFYEPEANSINFPAAILAPPMYNHNGPVSLNFGGMGVVMGHEITHGFDTIGGQYDENGNAIDWWTPKTKSKFIRKAQCFVEQYGNFSLPEGNVNGRMTAPENIADNGGIHQAFNAYRNWVRENNNDEEEPRLPGLENLSHDQLFFLGFATTWCENVTPEKARELLLVDVHSPGRFRALGGVMNSPAFAESFGCPRKAPMNPRNKCVLW
ncbi:unnamed protein product [Allacma fusca]|uniref:Neprilysin n=1 Tax=Allacma fusca TaxID=39272 RepID=A0A8J2LL04_9HEXA|nr:unnamed protein product [Allacma fusca]